PSPSTSTAERVSRGSPGSTGMGWKWKAGMAASPATGSERTKTNGMMRIEGIYTARVSPPKESPEIYFDARGFRRIGSTRIKPAPGNPAALGKSYRNDKQVHRDRSFHGIRKGLRRAEPAIGAHIRIGRAHV